jgi:predicted deacetylase
MPNKEPLKLALSIHDFGFLMPGYEDLLRLKEHYPNFKMTCFTIPMPKEFFTLENQKHFKVKKYKEWAKFVNECGFIEVSLHGFSHTENEMNSSYQKAEMLLKAAENLFKNVGLNYKKIFVAPYWQYSYDALQALKDNGWTVELDRNNLPNVPEGTKVFTYNWSFEEQMPPLETVIGHGHTMSHGVKNDMGTCFQNILKQIPEDTEFKFLSEIL